jgi:signal transduction histidine kinase
MQQIADRYYAKALQESSLNLNLQQNVFSRIDAQTFPSIITNLIDNAFKYTGPSKQIHLSLAQKNGQITIQVADNGFGISAEDRGKIFERFYRVGNENTRQTKGTGLGLYIVQSIVQKHGGQISVHANQEKGTVFEISLNAA